MTKITDDFILKKYEKLENQIQKNNDLLEFLNIQTYFINSLNYENYSDEVDMLNFVHYDFSLNDTLNVINSFDLVEKENTNSNTTIDYEKLKEIINLSELDLSEVTISTDNQVIEDTIKTEFKTTNILLAILIGVIIISTFLKNIFGR